MCSSKCNENGLKLLTFIKPWTVFLICNPDCYKQNFRLGTYRNLATFHYHYNQKTWAAVKSYSKTMKSRDLIGGTTGLIQEPTAWINFDFRLTIRIWTPKLVATQAVEKTSAWAQTIRENVSFWTHLCRKCLRKVYFHPKCTGISLSSSFILKLN